MGGKKVLVRLSTQERQALFDITSKRTSPSKLIKRAYILLALDTSNNRAPYKDVDICKMYNTSSINIRMIREDYQKNGIYTFIHAGK